MSSIPVRAGCGGAVAATVAVAAVRDWRQRATLLRFAAFLMVLVWWAGQTVYAAEDNRARIKDRLAQLDKLKASDATKQEQDILRQATEFYERYDSVAASTKDLTAQLKQLPAALQQLQNDLAQPVAADDQLGIDYNASLEDLTRQLDGAHAELDTARNARAELVAQSERDTERRAGIPGEASNIGARLEQVKATLADTATANAKDPKLRAERWRAQAEKQFLEQQFTALQLDSQYFDASRELVRLRKQQAERTVLKAERKVAALEEAVNNRNAQLADEAKKLADQQRVDAVHAHPAVRAIVESNQDLAGSLSYVSERSRYYADEKKRIEDRLTAVRKSFEGARAKVTQVGLTDAVGLQLRNQRLQLLDVSEIKHRLREHRKEMNRAQLHRLELEDELSSAVDLDMVLRQRLQAYRFKSIEERNSVAAALKDALTEHINSFVIPLVKAYDVFFDDILVPLHESEQQMLDLTTQFREFIDERILWVQSTHRLSLSDLSNVWEALFWLINPEAWGRVFSVLVDDLGNHPFVYVLMITFGFVLIRPRKLKSVLTELGIQAENKSHARFGHTIVALGVTALLAMMWTAPLFFLAWRLAESGDDSFLRAVAAALYRVGVLASAALFMVYLVRGKGVAESHLCWSATIITRYRRDLRWFLTMVVPFVFIVAAMEAQPLVAYRESLGRIAFVIAMGLSVWFIRNLFQPDRGLFSGVIKDNPNGWLARLRYVWYPALVGVPIYFIGGALLGYQYTSIQLEQRIVDTALLVFAVILMRDVTMRWLTLEQRRLAVEQARKRFAALIKARNDAAAESKSETKSDPATESDSQLEEKAMDIAAVSAQTQRMIRTSVGTALFFGFVWVWYDVFPALRMFDQFVLWTDTEVGPDGPREVNPITMADMLFGFGIFTIAMMIARNIPGVLEIAVLQHLPITPAVRYAVTTVVRYIITIIGLIAAFQALGVGWSKVQWLAAAITVGLGFGLQEIFANFISGLIILFGRSVRVGDIVTINNVSGQVSHIQIRATTITDWDHREHLIPNKTLVTGQVINWSLSDTILRLPIAMGVAYGSDLPKVTEMLLTIARAHPRVLKCPEPTAFVTAFGNGTMDLVLRVFLAAFDDLYSVRHDLIISIQRELEQAGIHVVFSARDPSAL